jgi:hypothetical protein
MVPDATPVDHAQRFSFNGDCINTVKAHEDSINCMITLDNGSLVTGSDDTLIKVGQVPQHLACVCMSGRDQWVV